VPEQPEWRRQIQESLTAFLDIAKLAGEPLSMDEIIVEYLDLPHRPPASLPAGMMAIYGFWGDGSWLKLGKAGPKSSARYTSQHYGFSARSTLAQSLIRAHCRQPIAGFNPLTPGDWIKAQTHRVNILIPIQRRPELLSLLEAFLHVRLDPRFEGFAGR